MDMIGVICKDGLMYCTVRLGSRTVNKHMYTGCKIYHLGKCYVVPRELCLEFKKEMK